MIKMGAVLSLQDKSFKSAIMGAVEKVKNFSKETKATGKEVDKFDKKMKSSVGGVKKWIAGFVGVAAITMGIRSATTTFMEFDDTIRMVGAVSKATDEEMIALSNTAKSLGATTAWSASQVGKGMQYMGMAGFDANQTIAAMPGLLSLASASQTDLATASDIVSDALTMFNMKAEQSTELANIMARAATDSNTTVTMLGEAYKYVGATASAMGQDIKGTTAMLEVLASAGLKGSMGGTTLGNMLDSLSAKAKDGRLKVGKYAVSIQDANGNFRDAMSIMGDMKRALSGMTQVQKKAALDQIFSKRGARGAVILMKATEDYRKKLIALGTAHEENAAGEMAKRMEAGLGGAWRRIKSAMEGVAISFGEAIAPMLISGMNAITGAIESIRRNWDFLSNAIQIGAVALGAYKVAQIAMVLWSKKQVLWTTIMTVKQGGLATILNVTYAKFALIIAGAYAWIKVGKALSDVTTDVGQDFRVLTSGVDGFNAVLKKMINFTGYAIHRVIDLFSVLGMGDGKSADRWLEKSGAADIVAEVDKIGKKQKIGRYDPEFIKKQQEKAKEQVKKGEKDLISKVKLPKMGKLDLAKEVAEKSKEKRFKVLGGMTKFVRAFSMDNSEKDLAQDYSISEKKLTTDTKTPENRFSSTQANSRAQGSKNGTIQQNTFNFYDVGSKTVDELMAEFVPKFKLVCQNI